MTALTLADLSPQVRLHLPSRWNDDDIGEYVSARLVRGVAVLRDRDGDMHYLYLGRWIDHFAPVAGQHGHSGFWKVGRQSFGRLGEARAWIDRHIAAEALGRAFPGGGS